MENKRLVRSLPASPTKGRACLSSSAPGASPTNIMSVFRAPSPGTALVLVSDSLHFVHLRISWASFFSSSSFSIF